jgi:hypothetical protein
MTEPTEPSNYDQLYPGRFMKAGQFLGKKPTLTITTILNEELEGENNEKKIKVVIGFAETKLQLVACKTNGICLREMFGKILANWKGKKVTLFAGEWKGKEAVRVWGSPNIEQDMEVTVKLARRRAFNMTMHCTAKSGQVPIPPAAVIAPEENQACTPD